MNWSKREGWLKEQNHSDILVNEIVEKARNEKGMTAVSRKSAADILKSIGDRSKLRLSRTVDKTAKALHRQVPTQLVNNTSALLNTTSAWAKLHGDVPTSPQVAIQINLGGRFD